ncbi:MAG: riboflavin synthase [Leptospirales bacterium]|nr:riboflavin synthase [Leptospirales bacterium]
MFTGIVESTGRILEVRPAENGGALTFQIQASFASELSVGQSVAHNGVCLTIETVNPGAQSYQVTLVQETLDKSSLGGLQQGTIVNLERCLRVDARIDGHIVQGHVDAVGRILRAELEPGQKRFTVAFPADFEPLVVPQGSICIDGISLTVAASDVKAHTLDVCLIPHTLEITNAGSWKTEDLVNLEFDVLGKYAKKWMDIRGGLHFPE